jgi:4-amino-4-deoxy-L-arabinose transferase-like glycosyltransferase
VLYLAACAIAQPGADPVRDEPDLLAAAARLLDGQLVPHGVVLDPRAYLWHGPGLVALLAPFVALDVPLTAIRFTGPLLLFGAVLLFHRLLLAPLGPRRALLGAWAFGLYLPFFSVLPQVHKEPLAIALVVGGMLGLSRGLATGRWGPVVAAGACLGALAMVRLEYGWIALALLLLSAACWAVRRRSAVAPRLVALCAVAVALCVPWLVATHHVTGKAPYWGSSSGLSLYWMSPTLPGEDGQWHSPRTVAKEPRLAPFRPLFDRVAELDPVRSDEVLRDAGIANIRDRPLDYLRNVVANTSRLFFGAPTQRGLSVDRVLFLALVNALLLAALARAAWVLWRHRAALAPETLPIAVFTAVAIAAHLPVSASPRMLLPTVPPLVWLVVQAWAIEPSRWGRRRADARDGAPASVPGAGTRDPAAGALAGRAA